MRVALAAVALALASAGPALAASGSPKKPLVPPVPRLTEAQATRIFLQNDKVAGWLGHYPRRLRQTEATFTKSVNTWDVKVWDGPAGEVATGP